MKRNTLLVALLLSIVVGRCDSVFSQTIKNTVKWWNDLSVSSENKLPPHVNVIPYDDETQVSRLDYQSSSWYLDLNGTWKMAFYERPDQVDASVLRSDYDMSALDDIEVPGNMELQGFGTPVYVNTTNEFLSNPPYPPIEYNPVGVYMRDFDLPSAWKGRRTVLKFGAAKSALALYVNGRYVGYSEDSKTPAEFDVTQYLKRGKNHIAAMVYRWCDGSYLECQDMWRMSGLTRDVCLYSTPYEYIRDYKVTSTLGRKDAQVEVLFVLGNKLSHNVVVSASLKDSSGREVAVARQSMRTGEVEGSLTMCVENPQLWSSECPYLYTLTLTTMRRGKLESIIGGKVGLRSVEISNGLLKLNGEVVTIKGVNRHEHDPYTGHFVSRARMEQDAYMMKSLGINAVRTCHYPDDEYWYELCDELGIMVWDEANNESHAQGYGEGSLAKNDDWSDAIRTRCNNMLQRDKNHPSVIVWSLGNECGNGVCFEKAYEFMKQNDPSRPVSYERAELDWNTDIVGVMYPSVDYLSSYARGLLEENDGRRTEYQRPYIMVEYCHAMGNSMGGLSDYWDTIDKYPCLQGGFVWDWTDQSFCVDSLFRAHSAKLPFATRERDYYAVGGDLGDLPGVGNDGAFCANGVVTSTRELHPHAYELSAVYGGDYPMSAVDTAAVLELLSSAGVVDNKSDVEVIRDNDRILMSDGSNRVVVDMADGSISSWVFGGRELLAAPLRWNFARPATLNGKVDPAGARSWNGVEQLKVVGSTYHPKSNTCWIDLVLLGPDEQELRLREVYELLGNGMLKISYHVEPNGAFATLPKLGLQFGVVNDFRSVCYYGNRYETYPDRRRAQLIGNYDLPLEQLSVMTHVVPQEYGNHEAYWLALHGENGGLLINGVGVEPINFSVRDCEDWCLSKAERWYDLESSGHYIISVDYRQAGIGTATCGPGVRKPYQISGDSVYDYAFVLMPYCGQLEDGWVGCRYAQVDDWTKSRYSSTSATNRVSHISCSALPNNKYSQSFPANLFDRRRAIVGNYSEGWSGFDGCKELVFNIEVSDGNPLEYFEMGFCNMSNDWVLSPDAVELQWSMDGQYYSSWQSCAEKRPLQDRSQESRRVVWSLPFEQPTRATHLRVRVRHVGQLPEWHAFHGQNAWLMIDEITVR